MNNECGPSRGSPIDFVTRTKWNDPSRSGGLDWQPVPAGLVRHRILVGVHLETLKRINGHDGMTIVHIGDHSLSP
jgi:hypothetical protein